MCAAIVGTPPPLPRVRFVRVVRTRRSRASGQSHVSHRHIIPLRVYVRPIFAVLRRQAAF